MNQLIKEYPGRIIIIGNTSDENVFALYAITGRSSSSRARKLVVDEKEKTVFVVPTNESEIDKGNRKLLVYPSMWWGTCPPLGVNGIVVSNGKQTESLIEFAKKKLSPREILENGLSEWSYEPDAPHFTPRISAYINESDCMISILKRNEKGNEERNIFDVSLVAGKSHYISTYNGENTNPLPSFIGEPREIILQSSTPRDLCEEVFAMLNEEFRIATACVMMNKKRNTIEIFILNNKTKNL